MRLRTLGSLGLEGASFGRQKPLLLLAYLALEGPRSRRQLVELFWADAADGRDSLQTTIRRLKKIICELLVGNPLGIELAAAGSRYLTLSALADELASNLDILVNRDPTSPDRHQSMNASLQLSWGLLSVEQRDALMKLAVFRGGFDSETARMVSGTDRPLLESLTDFALVRMLPSGRFEQHPLIQQFAAARLTEQPDEERSLRESHARHFMTELAALGHAVLGGDTAKDALDWIETEMANIERAWSWAVKNRDAELLESASWPLAHLGEMRGRYRQSIQLHEAAVSALDANDNGAPHRKSIGSMLGCLSFLYFRVGATDSSMAAGKRAVEILNPIRSRSGNWGLWSAYEGMATSNLSLSNQAESKGYLAAGIELMELDRAQADGDPVKERIADVAVGISVGALAYLVIDAGEHKEAVALLEQATARFEPHRAPHLSYVYWQLGRVHSEIGDNQQARAWLEKGLQFSHEVGFLGLVGHTLNHLARVHLRLGDHGAAVVTCEQALPHALDSGDKWLHTSLLAAHGMALKASGDLQGARLAFRESLAGGAVVRRTCFCHGGPCRARRSVLSQRPSRPQRDPVELRNCHSSHSQVRGVGS